MLPQVEREKSASPSNTSGAREADSDDRAVRAIVPYAEAEAGGAARRLDMGHSVSATQGRAERVMRQIEEEESRSRMGFGMGGGGGDGTVRSVDGGAGGHLSAIRQTSHAHNGHVDSPRAEMRREVSDDEPSYMLQSSGAEAGTAYGLHGMAGIGVEAKIAASHGSAKSKGTGASEAPTNGAFSEIQF